MISFKTKDKSALPLKPDKEEVVTKTRAGRIRQAVVKKLASRRERKAADSKIEEAKLLDSSRTSFVRAKEIFGDNMYTIDDSIRLFNIDSKLKMNTSLMYVHFSEAQLKMMYGYTLLLIVFPSAMIIAKKYKENIRISETLTSSPAAKEVFEKICTHAFISS